MVKGKQKHLNQPLFYSVEGHHKMKVFSILDLSKKWENKAADISTAKHFPTESKSYKNAFIVQPTFWAFFFLKMNNAKKS